MKVLIITYYWPPSGGSGVQRWLKFVKYLPDFGVIPVVYTVDDPNYAMTDQSLKGEISEKVKVIKGKIWEPQQVLSWMGKKTNKTSAGFLNAEPSLFDKFMRFIRANYFIPDSRKFWIKPSVKILSDYIKNNQIDFLISTGPPHSTHLIALQLKEKFGLKWVADFRDPWTGIDYFHNLPLTEGSKNKHIELENKVLSSADQVIVVGETMKREFLKYNNRIKVISNGFDSYGSDQEITRDKSFTITYAGLMNSDRNPRILWKALGALASADENFKRDLKLIFVGSCSDEVLASIDEFGLSGNLNDKGYCDHQEVTNFQRAAQVLLLTVNNVPSAKGIVTGKVFEYLQAKRPILAIGPVDGDLAKIMQETNSGRIVDFSDESGMLEVVKDYYMAFKKGRLEVDSTGIDKYHRKSLAKELFKTLKELKQIDQAE